MKETKPAPAITGKGSGFRRAFSLFVFCGILLGIIWLSKRPRNDLILFAILLISAAVVFKIVDKFRWYQDLPVLFKRLIFYSVLIPISSIVVPIIEVLIMSAASIAFELETIFKNEKKD